MIPPELPQFLPVFPLSGAMLLPRSQLQLNIFEPRYLQMIEDCLKTSHRMIVMVQPDVRAGADTLSRVACAGRLTAFSETDDGLYLVTLTGVSRCQLAAEQTVETAYRMFEVEWQSFEADLGPAQTDPELDREALFALLKRFFRNEDKQIDWDSVPESEDELLINGLSMLCPLKPEDKQALLEAPTLTARREVFSALLDFAARGGNNKEMM